MRLNWLRFRPAGYSTLGDAEPYNFRATDDNDTGFAMDGEDLIAYMRALIRAAHAEGLAMGQKNAIGMVFAAHHGAIYYHFPHCAP